MGCRYEARLQTGEVCHTLILKKGNFMRYWLLVSAMLFATPSLAADFTIEMLNKDENGNKMVFSQEVVRVDVGDTINWVPTTKGHNVEMMASPNDMKFKSKVSKEASMTFDAPGIYYYLCSPHK